jgi:hypothetical protein
MKKLLYISKVDRRKELRNFIPELQKYFEFIIFPNIEDVKGLIKYYNKFKPDVVLIHHNKPHFTADYLKLFDKSYNIWWRNDERFPPEEYWKGINIQLFLLSSEDSVNYFINNKLDASQLMMGFNPYPVRDVERNLEMVFTGQNSVDKFPLSYVRKDIVHRLIFFPNFYCYGEGWGYDIQKKHYSINNYSKIGIAINHFDTSKTYSNRMYQIMGYKALCLCYHTKDIEKVFENIVPFKTWNDLIYYIGYYLKHEDKRIAIAERGYNFVNNNFTWKHQALKFIDILKERKII